MKIDLVWVNLAVVQSNDKSNHGNFSFWYSYIMPHQLFLRNISAVMNKFSVFYPLLNKKGNWGWWDFSTKAESHGTSIVTSITKHFNLSLKTGIFPTDWKFARVVPIPKTGNPESPSNYRPISILPIISKLLEKHVQSPYQHLDNNCPLSPNQWGFTEDKSTTTALLSFVHECQETLDNGGEVCSVFFWPP